MRKRELTAGPCAWEAAARPVLGLLGCASLVLAPTGWPWTATGLVALALAVLWSARPARRRIRTTLNLHPDGTATLVRNARAQPAEITGRAWISRVFCVIEVRPLDDDGSEWLAICAAKHSASDYRQLLGALRLGAFGSRGECLD